MRPERRVG